MNEPCFTVQRCKINYSAMDKKALEYPTHVNLVFCSYPVFCQILEAKRYDINFMTSTLSMSMTLLGYLILRCDLDKIKVLLSYHPDVSLKDQNGQTVFFYFKEWCFRPDTDNMLDILDAMLNIIESHEILQIHDNNGSDVINYYQKIMCQWEKVNMPIFSKINLDFTEKMIIRFENHIQNSKTLFSLMLPQIE